MSIEIFQKIKTKEVQPRVYAVLVDSPNGMGLTIEVGYSLEEAIHAAKINAIKHGGKIEECEARIWAIMDIEALQSQLLTLDVVKPKEELPKRLVAKPAGKAKGVTSLHMGSGNTNMLMKLISEKKDTNLLNLSYKRGMLSDKEFKYLKTKLYGIRGSKESDNGSAQG